MKKECTNCENFKEHASLSWEYGKCKLTGNYAENDFSAWGQCKEGKLWVGNTPELIEEARLADMPLWKRLFMD